MISRRGPPPARPPARRGRTRHPAGRPDASGPATHDAPAPPRDRYLDLLRTAALLRVVVYHVTGWVWLSVMFPAMGLMFGLGGSLMAASLRRGGPTAIGRRLRRLLLPLWTFGAVTLTLLLIVGWRAAPPGRLGWGGLIWWLVPARVPPVGGEPWAWAFNIGLWYVVTYLWLVVLSPALLRIFRRWPWPTLAVATVLPLVFLDPSVHVGYFVATYLSCWLVGFAHHDGLLRRVPVGRYACVVAGLLIVGGVWLLYAARTDRAFDLNHTPGANTLWSVAFVAVALRPRPGLGWLDRVRPVARVVRVVNARAVTI
jgi:hypothetical protein